jgi:hypothetical protein
MRGAGFKRTVAPEGVVLPKSTFLNTSVHSVTAGYFAAMGVPLLAGRDLTPTDATGHPTPVVVNQAFAGLFFLGRNPIGKRFVSGTDGTEPPTHVIVGLVANAKYRSMREPDPPTFYGLLDETASTAGLPPLLYVRTHGRPSEVAAAVRKVGEAIDPGVPLAEIVTVDQEVRNSLWQERIIAILSAFFAAASVVLVAIGLYGTLTRSVAERSREFAIRLALGAGVPHILTTSSERLVVAVACGLAAGVLASTAALRFARSLLFGIDPVDPLSYTGAAALILVCSALGAVVPVLRALRVDPAATLRSD